MQKEQKIVLASIIIFLLGGLALAFYLAQQITRPTPKAAEDNIVFTLSAPDPDETTKETTLTIAAKAPEDKIIRSLSAYISYDENIEAVEINKPTQGLFSDPSWEYVKSKDNKEKSRIEIIAAASPHPEKLLTSDKGAPILATVKLKWAGNVPATLALVTADSTSGAYDLEGNFVAASAENLILPKQEEPTSATEPTTPPEEPPLVQGSKIDIFAAGTFAESSDGEKIYPEMDLLINGKVVKTFTVNKGNPQEREFAEYNYTHTKKVLPNEIKVAFTNNGANREKEQDRNLRVDKIVLDGVIYQSEAYDTYSTGTWAKDTKCAGGLKRSEWLHCNGYLQFRAGSKVIGEAGQTRLTHEPKIIKFSRAYENPVVIAQPPTLNGGNTAVVRITDVHSNEFTLYIQEPSDQDGPHTTETVNYLVVESGRWKLRNRKQIEAGLISVNSNVGINLNPKESWQKVDFKYAFSKEPIILTQIQTNNDNSWAKTRQNFADPKGFQTAIEGEEKNQTPHEQETIGWIAMEESLGFLDETQDYEANQTTLIVTNENYTIAFSKNFANSPLFLGSIATYNGNNASYLRYIKDSLNKDQITVKIEEDTTFDEEVAHTQEFVNYLALQNKGLILGKEVSAPPVQQVDLSFAVSFKGATKETISAQRRTNMPDPKQQTVRVKIVNPALKINKTFNDVAVSYSKDDSTDAKAVYKGALVLDEIPPADGYLVFIKGPRHLQKLFCQNKPTGPCRGRLSSQIVFAKGENEYDFSTLALEAGDLPDPDADMVQDGVADARDWERLRALNTIPQDQITNQDLLVADLDLNGKIDLRDTGLLTDTLFKKYEEDEEAGFGIF
jgi:hypothetical protein